MIVPYLRKRYEKERKVAEMIVSTDSFILNVAKFVSWRIIVATKGFKIIRMLTLRCSKRIGKVLVSEPGVTYQKTHF